MRRREFITLIGGAAAWVSSASAQEPRRVIGFLASGSFAGERFRVADFVQGLKDTGFIEGNNINIEWRWAEGRYNRLPSLAGELVSRGVAVIRHWRVVCGKGGNQNHPDCFHDRCRSGQDRPC